MRVLELELFRSPTQRHVADRWVCSDPLSSCSHRFLIWQAALGGDDAPQGHGTAYAKTHPGVKSMSKSLGKSKGAGEGGEPQPRRARQLLNRRPPTKPVAEVPAEHADDRGPGSSHERSHERMLAEVLGF